MDATSIIKGWKQRLTAMAETPPYVFCDTPQHLIDEHYRNLTTFVGYSESVIADAETRLGIRCPIVFKTYLHEMGKSPGELFCGSDLAGVQQFDQFRSDALELLAETDPALTLPKQAIVFLFHQGYSFIYILGSGGFDGPAMQWTESEREPTQAAKTFAEMVDSELRLMESNHATSHKQGGYYMTLHVGGGSAIEYPALNSGDRPLERRRKGEEWRPFSG